MNSNYVTRKTDKIVSHDCCFENKGSNWDHIVASIHLSVKRLETTGVAGINARTWFIQMQV